MIISEQIWRCVKILFVVQIVTIFVKSLNLQGLSGYFYALEVLTFSSIRVYFIILYNYVILTFFKTFVFKI